MSIMYNENKVKQVISAIKDNRLDAMDDESLATLLSILSPLELDKLEELSFQELGGTKALKRIMDIRPYVRFMEERELYRIGKSEHYRVFLESLKNGNYLDLFSKLTTEELGDLKKYIYNNVSVNDEHQMNAADKIFKMISREIAKQDSSKKPVLQDLVVK